MGAPSTRLDPLPPEHTPALKPQFDSFFKSLGFVPNSVLTMQRKPRLVQAFVAMQSAIWDPDSNVDRGFKRLIAFVASRATGCRSPLEYATRQVGKGPGPPTTSQGPGPGARVEPAEGRPISGLLVPLGL